MVDVKTQVSPTRLQSHKKISFDIFTILLISVILALSANMILGPALKDTFKSVELSGFPANGGYADPALQQNVWNTIVSFQKTTGCDQITSLSITVQQEPDTQGVWIEGWLVNQCGMAQTYRIRFAPDPSGGTVFAISK
jgi:hypothetical protein